jgi:hypothetical protein
MTFGLGLSQRVWLPDEASSGERTENYFSVKIYFLKLFDCYLRRHDIQHYETRQTYPQLKHSQHNDIKQNNT